MEINPNITLFETDLNCLFLSIEGIEGSGKTTQINFMREYLESHGYRVLCLREPGGTSFGEILRSAILSSEKELNPLAEAYLFASSRAQLLHESILPFLAKDKSVVILDRYIDSSIAYQGHARGLGMQTILDIHSYPPLNILPQKTLYLKIDLQTSMQRQAKRGNDKDYFEKENQNFYQKLIDGYDECAQVFPNRITTIDAKGELLQVQAEIKTELDKLL